jgi:hypothetical protein
MDSNGLTRGQRRDLYIGGLVRRLIVAYFAVLALFAIGMGLHSVWPPLAWAVPIVLAVFVLGRLATARK